MAGVVTPEQCAQILRLIGALKKATENAKAMSLDARDERRASMTLCEVADQLRNARNNNYDVKASRLIAHYDKARYIDLMKIFRNSPHMQTLHLLGSSPWATIQETFDAAGVACPLEVRLFHAAYQEKLASS